MFRVVWRALSRRRDWEQDLDDEMRDHIAHCTAHLIRKGVAPDEAARRARLEFGSPETFKELCREAHGLRWPSEILQDIRYGIRTLAHSPGYTLVAMVSLSLAIAIATCGFSEVNGLILRDIPSIPHPDDLVDISAPKSYPFYLRWKDRRDLF